MSGKGRGNQFNLESMNGFDSPKSQSKVQNKKNLIAAHTIRRITSKCVWYIRHCSRKNRVLHHEISSFLIPANLSTDKIKADDDSLRNQNAMQFPL